MLVQPVQACSMLHRSNSLIVDTRNMSVKQKLQPAQLCASVLPVLFVHH